eukprot:scaffold90429_cov69-Phaeocystis_antarctica.AAC.2
MVHAMHMHAHHARTMPMPTPCTVHSQRGLRHNLLDPSSIHGMTAARAAFGEQWLGAELGIGESHPVRVVSRVKTQLSLHLRSLSRSMFVKETEKWSIC